MITAEGRLIRCPDREAWNLIKQTVGVRRKPFGSRNLISPSRIAMGDVFLAKEGLLDSCHSYLEKVRPRPILFAISSSCAIDANRIARRPAPFLLVVIVTR